MNRAAGNRVARPALRPLLAALAVVAAVLVVGLLGPVVRPTSAAWTDPVHARATVVVDATVAPEMIAAGQGFTCAVVRGDGWCWGEGGSGQLGDGTATTSDVPVAVAPGAMGDAVVTDIDTGNARTCAVAGGAAYCWGVGDLGDFDTAEPWQGPPSSVPVAVYAQPAGTGPNEYESPLYGRTVTIVGAGEFASCAVADDTSAACWGLNVGFPRPTDPSDPQSRANAPIAVPTSADDPVSQLPAGAPIDHVTTDFQNACVIAAGEPYCWGRNQEGQVGDGENGTAVLAPTAVLPGAMTARPVTDVDGGSFHTCAAAGGSAYCWGLRATGQIGDGGGISGTQDVPARVALPPGVSVTDVAAGGGTACALTADGAVYCWGSNTDGQLGNPAVGIGGSTDTPVEVDRSLLPEGVTFTSVVVGASHACATASDDEVYCWGAGRTLGTGAGQALAPRPEVPVTQTWAAAP
ncbi:hypothetical protein V5D56_00950 [Cellulosimicrobium sp. PMB13]|uniref:RCC1 domain-containing protein n=1 Tax=Cellulosimicrobium sp. PMB13 TaxID=3120158 RepID=UPI003F4BE225